MSDVALGKKLLTASVSVSNTSKKDSSFSVTRTSMWFRRSLASASFPPSFSSVSSIKINVPTPTLSISSKCLQLMTILW